MFTLVRSYVCDRAIKLKHSPYLDFRRLLYMAGSWGTYCFDFKASSRAINLAFDMNAPLLFAREKTYFIQTFEAETLSKLNYLHANL